MVSVRDSKFIMSNFWQPIKNYEGLYEISQLGEVRSLDRIVLKGKHKAPSNILGCTLKPSKNKAGYLKVGLSKEGKVSSFDVHYLMAETFMNHKRSGLEIVIDHIDNIKENNALYNLQLTSHRHNNQKDKVNKTGFLGIKKTTCNKYEAKCRINKKMVHLGNFNNPEKASEIYLKACDNVDKYNGCPKTFRQFLLSI